MAAHLSGQPVQFTANAQVNKVTGMTLLGIFVSSATSGTITVYDSNAGATTNKIVDTFTVAPGTFYPLYAACQQGHYIVIGGTVSATAILG